MLVCSYIDYWATWTLGDLQNRNGRQMITIFSEFRSEEKCKCLRCIIPWRWESVFHVRPFFIINSMNRERHKRSAWRDATNELQPPRPPSHTARDFLKWAAIMKLAKPARAVVYVVILVSILYKALDFSGLHALLERKLETTYARVIRHIDWGYSWIFKPVFLYSFI